MAKKRSTSKKKRAKAPKRKATSFREAMRALERVGAVKQHIGGLTSDGTHTIDHDKLEKLKKKVGEAAFSRVRFVALNAPFKRRSPITPA
jgi:nickel-dependent lactate racemase